MPETITYWTIPIIITAIIIMVGISHTLDLYDIYDIDGEYWFAFIGNILITVPILAVLFLVWVIYEIFK